MPDAHPNLIRVDLGVRPDDPAMTRAGEILSRDGVVIFPARCLYGIAANALSPKAVEKVFSLKARPKDNPILVLIRDTAMLKDLVRTVPEQAKVLMARFWSGRLTLVFEAADHISPLLTAHTGKIGIRLPGHPVAKTLVKTVDFPITGTSANLSGTPGCTSPHDLPQSIINGADLVLDAGPVRGGTGSTVVDVTTKSVKVLRKGALPEAEIFKALGR